VSIKRIYLDYAATTPAAPEVIDAMQPYLGECFGNASSLHDFGFRARRAVETARGTIADFLGAGPDDIIFTSSGTEANNMALQGCACAAGGKPVHIITSSIEHSSVFNTCAFLESIGHEVTWLPVNSDGRVNAADCEAAIKDTTVLISVQYANNEIGSIQPIAQIAEIAQRCGIVFHTDAVQTFGRIAINAVRLKITLLSASGHKLYGPKGSGFLYVNRRDASERLRARGIDPVPDTILRPLMYGGPQEAGLRPATENVPAIVGLGRAVELARDSMAGSAERERQLRDYAIGRLLAEIPGSALNGHPQERLPNNINIRFEGVSAYELVLLLDRHGIACSSGSACSSQSEKPSHVLTALGLTAEQAAESLRLTLGKYTEKEDIDYVIGNLPKLISTLKQK
jgi:cysteine desulfurase